jgi:hypothetical protein
VIARELLLAQRCARNAIREALTAIDDMALGEADNADDALKSALIAIGDARAALQNASEIQPTQPLPPELKDWDHHA